MQTIGKWLLLPLVIILSVIWLVAMMLWWPWHERKILMGPVRSGSWKFD